VVETFMVLIVTLARNNEPENRNITNNFKTFDMRTLLILFALVFALTGCVKKNKVPVAKQMVTNSMHEVKVDEVIQTTNYTYLKVSETDKTYWMAVSRQEAAVGETYFYEEGMEMKNFKSKELDRTFESIYFVQSISKEPASTQVKSPAASHTGKVTGSMKEGISITPAENGLTIAKLFANRTNYEGKIIKMKGKVVKINEQVMGKNWIHLQDGTNDNGNFDLTVTSLDAVKVDDIATFEGIIRLKKDFGYGYFYELIMEDAKLIQ
jgi:hypothetical protein